MEAHFSLHRGASALAGGGPALRDRLSAVSEYPGLAPRAAATPRRRSPSKQQSCKVRASAIPHSAYLGP